MRVIRVLYKSDKQVRVDEKIVSKFKDECSSFFSDSEIKSTEIHFNNVPLKVWFVDAFDSKGFSIKDQYGYCVDIVGNFILTGVDAEIKELDFTLEDVKKIMLEPSELQGSIIPCSFEKAVLH